MLEGLMELLLSYAWKFPGSSPVLDALKDEEQLKNVQEMLQGLYKHYMYHYSPKALRELKELAQLLDEK